MGERTRRALLATVVTGGVTALAGCSSGRGSGGGSGSSGNGDEGPDGSGPDRGAETTEDGPEQGKVIGKVEARKVNKRGFETLTLTYEKLELDPQSGSTVSLDVGKTVDMTSEEVGLSKSFLVTCIPADTYVESTHYLSVEEAKRKDGSVSFGDVGPFSTKLTPEEGDGTGVKVNSDRRVSFTAHLRPQKGSDGWSFDPYVGRSVLNNPSYC